MRSKKKQQQQHFHTLSNVQASKIKTIRTFQHRQLPCGGKVFAVESLMASQIGLHDAAWQKTAGVESQRI